MSRCLASHFGDGLLIYLGIDDVFKSTVHRAVNRTGIRRYSIPLFFGTDYDVRLEVRTCSHVPCRRHLVHS